MSALDKWLCFALGKLESRCQVSVFHRNRLLLSKGHWVLLCGSRAELFPHGEARQCSDSVRASVFWWGGRGSQPVIALSARR